MRSLATRTTVLALTCAAALTVAAPTGVSAHPRSGPSYRTEPLGTALPGSAHGINDRGVVVGVVRTPEGLERGFVWHPRTRQATQIATFGGQNSQANDVNDKGVVVGAAESATNDDRAFRYDSRTGVVQDLGTLGGDTAVARAINERGVVVGEAETAAGETHAFRWDPRTGRMQDLGTLGGERSSAHDINDKGVVVGDARTAQFLTHAFRWDPRERVMDDLGVLPGTVVSFARGINDRGDIVGSTDSVADNAERAFLWSARTRTMRAFLDSGGTSPGTCCNGPVTRATAINDRGLVVGSQEDVKGSRAYVWSARTGQVLLPGLGTENSASADDINDRGTIVGNPLVRWIEHGRRG